MPPNTTIPLLSGLICLLALACALCLRRIARLKKELALAHERAHVPTLTLALDSDDQIFSITNDGACTAKDIRIQDLAITLEYDFKKVVTLRFAPIPLLHPTKSAPLTYTLHDGEYPLAKEAADSFFAHLLTADFTAIIFYQNVADIEFATAIRKTKDQFRVEEIQVLEEDQDNAPA